MELIVVYSFSVILCWLVLVKVLWILVSVVGMIIVVFIVSKVCEVISVMDVGDSVVYSEVMLKMVLLSSSRCLKLILLLRVFIGSIILVIINE